LLPDGVEPLYLSMVLQQAVVPYFYKTFGQDMKLKTP